MLQETIPTLYFRYVPLVHGLTLGTIGLGSCKVKGIIKSCIRQTTSFVFFLYYFSSFSMLLQYHCRALHPLVQKWLS